MLQCQAAGMPIGVTITLTSQWLDPTILHWYIDNIGPNSGVVSSGSAGVGYNHVSQTAEHISIFDDRSFSRLRVQRQRFLFYRGSRGKTHE